MFQDTSLRITPVLEPVTGREPPDDPARPLTALSQFYCALNARDLRALQANWDDSADVAMDNPLGGIRRGWPEIRSTYELLCRSPAEFWFELWDYTMHETARVFWAVGRERGQITQHGARPLDLAIRTTRVFRRDRTGRWRQVHHHGSIDDPDMLAAYQRAVRRAADA